MCERLTISRFHKVTVTPITGINSEGYSVIRTNTYREKRKIHSQQDDHSEILTNVF